MFMFNDWIHELVAFEVFLILVIAYDFHGWCYGTSDWVYNLQLQSNFSFNAFMCLIKIYPIIPAIHYLRKQ